MQKNRKIVLMAFLLIATCLTTALGTLYFTRTIGNNVTIKAAWNIALFRWDTQAYITSIAWGEVDPGTLITTNQLFSGTCLKIKNNGNAEVFVAWQLDPTTPLPPGVVLTASYEYAPGAMHNLAQNDFSEIEIGPGQFSGSPTEMSPGRIEFDLNVGLYASPGGISFNILLLAADTNLG